MNFALSRVMHPSDYDMMPEEVARVDYCQDFVRPPHPQQHRHRRWEQSLAWKAVVTWFRPQLMIGDRDLTGIKVSDWGCAVGLLPALMAFAGASVDMFEPWVYGDESEFLYRQMSQVLAAEWSKKGSYTLANKCLGGLDESWWGKYDISFCISTIEHIGEYEKAFTQLCKTVKPGGLLFLTMDYGDGKTPDSQYASASVRPCGMPTVAYMEKLKGLGEKEGFWLFGGVDWNWAEECRMVNNYSFASLCMVKRTRQ